MMKYCCALMSILAAATSCTHPPSVTEYRLSNGLGVTIISVKKSELASLVTLYSIGETSDPEGQSGMAHLLEHLYVTSAAGEFPSRNIEQFVADYPQGWNAQTGMDYTVVATVFPTSRIDLELRTAVARMKSLAITEEDLEREIPRLEAELANMYGRVPMLASMNRSAAMLFGSGPTRRKGGVIEQIRTITLHELRARVKMLYKPANAQLIICGPFDTEELGARIEALFSDVETGKAMSAFTTSPPPGRERLQIEEVPPLVPDAQSCVALSYRAPSASDRISPAFLVLVRRLQLNAGRLNLAPNSSLVFYAPLDRPEVVSLVRPVGEQETAEAVLDRLRKYVDEMTTATLDGGEKKNARQYFGFAFCRETYPDLVAARDPYGAAFCLGRMKQMGINGDTLMRRIETVTSDELSAAAEYFARDKSAAAIVKVKE